MSHCAKKSKADLMKTPDELQNICQKSETSAANILKDRINIPGRTQKLFTCNSVNYLYWPM